MGVVGTIVVLVVLGVMDCWTNNSCRLSIVIQVLATKSTCPFHKAFRLYRSSIHPLESMAMELVLEVKKVVSFLVDPVISGNRVLNEKLDPREEIRIEGA